MINRIKKSISFRYRNYQYKRLTSMACKPQFDYQSLIKEGFYSQCGQDKWLVNELFPNKQQGVFVDIGVHDGVSFSNSYFLEKLGWTGLAIEPIPDVYKKLANIRECITVNACISQQEGVKIFRKIEGYCEMLSGLVDQYDKRHLQRIENEINKHGGTFNDIEVQCFNLNALLSNHDLQHVNYLSIDVEGGEMDILKSIDFNAINIAVISVENNYRDYKIPQFLNKKGFQLNAILGDEIYINKSNLII